MYSEGVQAVGEQAAVKLEQQRRSLLSHLVRSGLAGMYVGIAIVLIFTIGGFLPKTVQKLVMGVCFGGALTIVIFAGSELFTGSNLVLTLGVLTGKARWRDLLSNWVYTWIGNLIGAVVLAVMVVRSGVLNAEPIHGFILKVVETKMTLPPEQLFWRRCWRTGWSVSASGWRCDSRKKQRDSDDLVVHVHLHHLRL